MSWAGTGMRLLSTGSNVHLCLQTFFRGGYYDIGQTAAYFEECTQKLLLEKHLVKQDVEAMPLASAQLTWDIFQLVGTVRLQGRHIVSTHMGPSAVCQPASHQPVIDTFHM